MSQEQDSLQEDYGTFNLKAWDDNATDYFSTDKPRPPELHKLWLDKLCTELRYRNLTFLTDLHVTSSTSAGFDTTVGNTGFKIIKALIVLLL